MPSQFVRIVNMANLKASQYFSDTLVHFRFNRRKVTEQHRGHIFVAFIKLLLLLIYLAVKKIPGGQRKWGKMGWPAVSRQSTESDLLDGTELREKIGFGPT